MFSIFALITLQFPKFLIGKKHLKNGFSAGRSANIPVNKTHYELLSINVTSAQDLFGYELTESGTSGTKSAKNNVYAKVIRRREWGGFIFG